MRFEYEIRGLFFWIRIYKDPRKNNSKSKGLSQNILLISAFGVPRFSIPRYFLSLEL